MKRTEDLEPGLCVTSHVKPDLLADFVPPLEWRTLAAALADVRQRNALVLCPVAVTIPTRPRRLVPGDR